MGGDGGLQAAGNSDATDNVTKQVKSFLPLDSSTASQNEVLEKGSLRAKPPPPDSFAQSKELKIGHTSKDSPLQAHEGVTHLDNLLHDSMCGSNAGDGKDFVYASDLVDLQHAPTSMVDYTMYGMLENDLEDGLPDIRETNDVSVASIAGNVTPCVSRASSSESEQSELDDDHEDNLNLEGLNMMGFNVKEEEETLLKEGQRKRQEKEERMKPQEQDRVWKGDDRKTGETATTQNKEDEGTSKRAVEEEHTRMEEEEEEESLLI